MDISNLIIILLSITPTILIVYISSLNRDINTLRSKLETANSKIEKYKNHEKKEVSEKYYIGSKVLYPEYQLVQTSTDKVFFVDYELEIIDISEDKVKVKSIDFQGYEKIGRDPFNRTDILEFINNKWVSKKSIKIIRDESFKRNLKLNELGIE